MSIRSDHSQTCTRHVTVLLASLVLVCASVQSQNSPSHPASQLTKRVVGDYGYWSKYQTPPYAAAQIPIAKLTHINHFGVSFGSNGSLYIPDGFIEPALLRKAHKAGVKVLLGLNGDYPALDGNPALTATLVGNLWTFIQEKGYDGIDLDWEYPSTEEGTTFYNLLFALRTAFPTPNYVLSADVPPWGGQGGYDVPQVNPLLDYFNIMMYDCAGPWTADGQLNSEIFWDASDPDPWECQPGGAANEAIAIFLQEGVPPLQLNLGTPFYGYFYSQVSALFGTCANASREHNGDCNGSVVSENYGTWIKQRINKKGWQTFYDPVALVPYMLRADGKEGFITYDDEFSTYYRVAYADWQQGLGGTFMWSLDADYDGHSQDLLNEMYAASLNPDN